MGKRLPYAQERVKVMNCHYCQGVDTVEERLTRFCAYDASAPFVVDNVPGFVCRLCGEKSFSDKTTAKLAKVIKGEVLASGQRVFQVFDFIQVDSIDAPTLTQGETPTAISTGE